MVFNEQAGFRLHPKERAVFKELSRRKIPFILVGLSAATLQGAPVVTQDLDLWVKDLSDPKFKNALKAIGASYIPPIHLNPPMIVGEGLELLDLVVHVTGLKSFREEYRHCLSIEIEGIKVKVLSLEKIIQSKEALGRKKDKSVLPALKDFLKILKESKKNKF